jgi:hypothetical protein
MNGFFENPEFVVAYKNLSKNREYCAQKLLAIMKEMREEISVEVMNIDCYICVLNKHTFPEGYLSPYGSLQYLHAIKEWNNYVFHNNKDFDLLIHPLR